MILRLGSPAQVGVVQERLVWNQYNTLHSVVFRVVGESDFESWVALRQKLGLRRIEPSSRFLSCHFYEVEILD